MRAVWSGAIAFGLVNIPVKMYTAVRESTLDFDMLDRKDHARIRFKRVNETSQKEVPWNEIVKGYDLGGEYVILSDEDFERASPENSRLIEITAFILEKEINSIYYEKPYYLVPDKNGERAYALLLKTLQKSGMAGLGTYVMRNREHLALIKVYQNAIVLNNIRFEDEIVKPEVYELDELGQAVKDPELKMALSLVEQMQTEFDIDRYHDTYTSRLLNYIKAKAKGVRSDSLPVKRLPGKGKNLMEQLKASLQAPRSPKKMVPKKKVPNKRGV